MQNDITEEDIKRRAYKIYLRRFFSRQRGDEKSDYFRARQELIREKETCGYEESIARY